MTVVVGFYPCSGGIGIVIRVYDGCTRYRKVGRGRVVDTRGFRLSRRRIRAKECGIRPIIQFQVQPRSRERTIRMGNGMRDGRYSRRAGDLDARDDGFSKRAAIRLVCRRRGVDER